ncbi:MAG: Stk1 family PASTA domain-containing Ser/Thr kinase [Oscillospiraceae bacterium]
MEQYIGRYLDNRYELLEVIGTGGMAVVYKARCHRLNRLVAVKILKSDLAQDEEFRRRFHDESQAVAMLSHPNIVAVYDVSRSSDLDYIVMELIDGITLKQYMQKKGGPLNWREALHFITQIMRALSHAHSRGIIHRDIKPHNIMVLRDGSVKVADFGIARLTSAAQNTLTQEALGSVHYISPEQARGSHVDARSDIYSAGVVLYEMITGRLPFEGESPVSVAIQHINSVAISPRELNPDIPEALEAITQKAMATNMDQRYVSADAMLTDLEEFRKNPSINFDYTTADLAPDPNNDEPTRKVPANEVIAGVAREEARARAKKRAQKEEEDDVEYDERPARSGPIPILLALGAILIFIGGIGYFLWVTFFSGLFAPPENYDVPKLEGMTIVEIETKHPELIENFVLKEGATVENALYDAGVIVSQEPEAGKKVKEKGTIIVVDISAGQDEIKMPETYNMEQRAALDLLETRMHLTVHQEYHNSENVTKGYVISSTPAAGTVLLPHDEVTLVISQGPKVEKVAVPVFVGLTLEKAKEQLTVLKLTLESVEEVYDLDHEPGYVIGQSVDAGTEVDAGSNIVLKVSKDPVDPDAPAPSPTAEQPAVSPTPTATVSPAVSPTPTASPTPTTTIAPTVTKAVKVELPDREGTFRVVITVGGVEKWTNTVDRSIGTLTPRVSGSGVEEVCVYIDGALVRQYKEDFSK